MKHNFYIVLFFLQILAVKSQISISVSNMPVSGDTIRYSNAKQSSVGNYTVTGANYIWHFDTLRPISQALREFKGSLSTPYFFYFLPPKYGEKTIDSVPIPISTFSIKNIYSFYKKNGTTSFNSEGLGLTLSGIPVGATFTDEDELYKFPLNYLDRDSTRFSLTTPTSTLIPFTYKKHGYRITEADGWGTITTPYGTANCLRVITTQFSIDTITINALPIPFNKLGFPNYERRYQWLSLGEKIPYFEVTGTLIGSNFTPTQFKYRDNIKTFVGLKNENLNPLTLGLFPNPSSTQITLLLPRNEAPVKATMTDLQGKVMQTIVFENNTEIINIHHIDVSNFAKGVYFIHLSTNSQNQSLKIIVQ